MHIWEEKAPREWVKVFTYEDKKNSMADSGYSVNFVKFSPTFYGLKLACCTAKGTITVFDYRNGKWDENYVQKEEAHAKSINSIAWAPAGNGLTDSPNDPILCTASCDRTVKIFDCSEDSIIELYSIPNFFKDSVRSVDWNQFSLLGNNLIASSSQDKKLILFALYRNTEGELYHETVLETDFESEVWRVRFNRTGSMLAASYIERDQYNKVAIFKTVDGKLWEKTEDLFVSTA